MKEWEEEQKEEAEEEAARQLEETKKEGTEKKEEKRNWWESTESKEEQERRWAKTWLVKEPGKGSAETPEAPTEAPVEGPKKNKCGSEKQKAKLKWVEGQAKEKGASDQELELMRLGALGKSEKAGGQTKGPQSGRTGRGECHEGSRSCTSHSLHG